MSNVLDHQPNEAWKRRFRSSWIAWAKIAPGNPGRGLVCSDRDGVFQLYAWDVASGDLRQLTDRRTGVVRGILSSDGESIYYLQDQAGNETGHFVRIPFCDGEPEDVTPDLPPYSAIWITDSRSGRMLGTTMSDADGHRLCVFAPGESPRTIHRSRKLFVGPAVSYDGELAVIGVLEGTGSMDLQLVAIDVETGEPVAELWDGEGTGHRLGTFAPLPGDFRLLTSTSRSGFARPMIWNPHTGERHDLAVDHIPGDVASWSWNPDGRSVLLSYVHEAAQSLYIYDLEADKVRRLSHPVGMFGGGVELATRIDDDEILITWSDASNPPSLIAPDPVTGQHTHTVLSVASDAPAGRPWRAVRFAGANGDRIHGWLATPDGEGPFPTILHTHGGPTAVMMSGFAPESQAWLDHGFAFLSVNFHGSTTFGKDFEKSIFGRLGELEVEDMAAGYEWLVENSIAQPDAVFLTGGSYGGYLTLHALGTKPDIWAGGMASVAVADWSLMYEDESEPLRGIQHALLGGSPDEAPEVYRKSSPITYAEQVQAPLLVLQGRNDTRCPARQMKVYEEKLKALGKQIDVHWFDAGHGAFAQEQRIEHQEMKLRFALDVLNRA